MKRAFTEDALGMKNIKKRGIKKLRMAMQDWSSIGSSWSHFH